MSDERFYENKHNDTGESKNSEAIFEEVKKSLEESLKKIENQGENTGSPEIALEVFDEKIEKNKPEKQAIIAEHMFRRAIEKSIPCGIVAIDNDGNQVYVNKYFCEMVGWNDDELLGSEFPYANWTNDREDINKEIFINEDLPSEGIEVLFQRKNKTRFWGLVSSAVLADSQGNNIGRILSIADISSRKKSEQELRILSSKLINVQEKERKNLSRDLHDSIGGKLTAIKYSMEKAVYDFQHIPELVKSMQDIVSILRDTTDEIHRISRNLHPSILDDLGLVSALRGFCREYSEVYSDIQILYNFDIDEKNIPDSLTILIYRVMQEALNNIAKHSRADQVKISLEETEEYIELIIEDNGQGFDIDFIAASNSTMERMGLNSMKERAELFGGLFEIKSDPGKGTSVKALWPLG